MEILRVEIYVKLMERNTLVKALDNVSFPYKGNL